MNPHTASPQRSLRSLLLLLVGVGGVAVLLMAVGLNLPLWKWAQIAVGELRSGGVSGVLAFGVAHVAAIVLFVPVTPFVFAAGMVWGTAGGAAVVTCNNVIGTTLAFVLAQWGFRPVAQRYLGEHRHVRAIDRAMVLGGFRAVVMLRLSPIVPMSILNYGLGLFDVRVRTYVAATTVGLLPITVLYCWGAAGVGELSDVAAGEVAAGPWQQAMFWLGLAATFGAVWWLQRLAARALAETGTQASANSANTN